jgi:hypothetical protein
MLKAELREMACKGITDSIMMTARTIQRNKCFKGHKIQQEQKPDPKTQNQRTVRANSIVDGPF